MTHHLSMPGVETIVSHQCEWRLGVLTPNPRTEQTKNQEAIEEAEKPHAADQPIREEQLGERDGRLSRRVPISMKDLKRVG